MYTLTERTSNAFSPNGDGNNDVFKIINLHEVDLKSFEIYNRWGQRVFYTTDWTKGWDGNIHGKHANIGTYFYLIKIIVARHQLRNLKGDLTLLR